MTIDPLTAQEIEVELDKLQSTSTQRRMIDDVSQIIADRLHMKVLSIRGFYTMALIEWQQDKKSSVASGELTGDVSKETRTENANKVFDIFRKRIQRVIKVKRIEKELDEAIAAAMDHYRQNYASRPRDTK